jgi:hypothetical protein
MKIDRLIFPLLLTLFVLSSCEEFGANAVDGSELRLVEGDRLVYEDVNPQEFFFGPSIPEPDRAEYRLISDIAVIGGRENVNAFEFSRDRSIVFSEVIDGRIWQAFKATDELIGLTQHNAVWLRIPRVGEESVSGVVSDSTFFEMEEVFTSPIRRFITLTALESIRFYAGGYHFPATKVQVDYDITQDFSTHRVTDVVTYIESLGIVGQKEFNDPFRFDRGKLVLDKIVFED